MRTVRRLLRCILGVIIVAELLRLFTNWLYDADKIIKYREFDSSTMTFPRMDTADLRDHSDISRYDTSGTEVLKTPM